MCFTDVVGGISPVGLKVSDWQGDLGTDVSLDGCVRHKESDPFP